MTFKLDILINLKSIRSDRFQLGETIWKNLHIDKYLSFYKLSLSISCFVNLDLTVTFNQMFVLLSDSLLFCSSKNKFNKLNYVQTNLNHFFSIWTTSFQFEPLLFNLNHFFSIWTTFFQFEPLLFNLNQRTEEVVQHFLGSSTFFC